MATGVGVAVPPAVVTYSAATNTPASATVMDVATTTLELLATTTPAATQPVSQRSDVPMHSSAKAVEPYHRVPFYSQFTDISDPAWRGVGCGIASVAMLIDYYSDKPVNVDVLLATGRKAGAFLPDAGWTHAGLIDLARPYGLTGVTTGLSHLSMAEAFAALRSAVAAGPVMVSVHYTFDRSNPIPHLAVITGIDDTLVYYNDPAEPAGENSLSIAQFQSAWKQRYIAFAPAT